MTKPKHEKMSWTEISKILNAQGPSVRSAEAWLDVRTIKFVEIILLVIYQHSGMSTTKEI